TSEAVEGLVPSAFLLIRRLTQTPTTGGRLPARETRNRNHPAIRSDVGRPRSGSRSFSCERNSQSTLRRLLWKFLTRRSIDAVVAIVCMIPPCIQFPLATDPNR